MDINSKLGVVHLEQLDQRVWELLTEFCDLVPEDLQLIKGDKLHAFMISHSAYASAVEGKLVFFGVSDSSQKKFLYYLGAENEAKLTLRVGDLSVYEDIDPDRLEHKLDDPEVEPAQEETADFTAKAEEGEGHDH